MLLLRLLSSYPWTLSDVSFEPRHQDLDSQTRTGAAQQSSSLADSSWDMARRSNDQVIKTSPTVEVRNSTTTGPLNSPWNTASHPVTPYISCLRFHLQPLPTGINLQDRTARCRLSLLNSAAGRQVEPPELATSVSEFAPKLKVAGTCTPLLIIHGLFMVYYHLIMNSHA